MIGIKTLILCICVALCCSKTQEFMKGDRFFNQETIANVLASISSVTPEDIFNVRCFWIKGWNVFDISPLERAEKDWNFTTSEGSTFYYNFCRNTYTECRNSTDIANPATMIGFDKNSNCKRLSSSSDKFNTFALLNPDNSSLGLQITFSTGETCNDGAFYTTVFNITCDPTMEKGYVELFNKEEFSLSKCKNILVGKSFETCPKVNYYIISYFMDKYSSVLGGVIMAVGIFLIVFGAKFVKVTLFVTGVFTSITVFAVVYFTIFTANSAVTVWYVLGVGLVVGIALSYFLIQITNAFFMVIGGYMGYTLGIFLYNLVLYKIQGDPKVVFWVTIIACVIFFAIISLWFVKHIMIIATSVCGGYAIVRGMSLYVGHFPSESVILDLVQHQEWDQFDSAFEGYVYIYLGVWLTTSLVGIFWQYRSNSDKSSDDYRKIE